MKDITRLGKELYEIIKEESYDRTQKARIHNLVVTHIKKNYNVRRKFEEEKSEEELKKYLATNRKLHIHYIIVTPNFRADYKSSVALYLAKNKKLLKRLSKK